MKGPPPGSRHLPWPRTGHRLLPPQGSKSTVGLMPRTVPEPSTSGECPSWACSTHPQFLLEPPGYVWGTRDLCGSLGVTRQLVSHLKSPETTTHPWWPSYCPGKLPAALSDRCKIWGPLLPPPPRPLQVSGLILRSVRPLGRTPRPWTEGLAHRSGPGGVTRASACVTSVPTTAGDRGSSQTSCGVGVPTWCTSLHGGVPRSWPGLLRTVHRGAQRWAG